MLMHQGIKTEKKIEGGGSWGYVGRDKPKQLGKT